MLSFPFEIPPSLYSYLEKFEDNPQRITEKLENQLQRRGQDPIGQLLLAWFYLKREKNDKALTHAIKAKAMAPGSPLLEFLPYFIQHPESFTAWQPSSHAADQQVAEPVFVHPSYPNSSDLDTLIEQISKVDHGQLQKSKMGQMELEENKDKDLSTDSEKIDDLVSETLAEIYEMQNQHEDAIRIYKKLAELYPDKASTYEKTIERLQKEIDS